MEWEHYTFSIRILSDSERATEGCLGILLLPLTWFLFFIPTYELLQKAIKGRVVAQGRGVLKGYQKQDAWAFKEAIDASLKEALDRVGISAGMIREMPKEGRVI